MGLILQNQVDTVKEDVDLVVIGGGPTGLLSALLASRMGLSVSVIDAKPQSLDLGRADALNARTQQYLEVVGILDELLPQGLKCNTSSTFGDGVFKSRQSHWWTGLQHCLHKNFLMIGQPVVEKLLLDRLSAGDVHYSESVVAISEDDDSVTVSTSKGRTVRATYAVAADGARSTVRNALGIPFTGTKPEMLWAVLDTFIDSDFPRCNEIITFQHKGQSRVSWIPRERGMARFYVLLEGEVTQERAEASIKEHLAPYKVEFTRTEWYSTFDVKERIASTFVSKDGNGRIILAGDAAHVHSVNGGQGLNTGIADAFALAWRVVYAVNKGGRFSLTSDAARKLIRSYDTERRTTAEGVIDVAAKLVRDTIKTAKEYVSTIERNAAYITGMGVAYDGIGSDLVQEGEQVGIWRPGYRCPDMLLSKGGAEGDSKWLYSTVEYGKFLVISVGGARISRDFSDATRHIDLLPAGAELGAAGSQESFFAQDVSGEEQCVVVVRPDMYVGYVGTGDGWKDYMGRLFTN